MVNKKLTPQQALEMLKNHIQKEEPDLKITNRAIGSYLFKKTGVDIDSVSIGNINTKQLEHLPPKTAQAFAQVLMIDVESMCVGFHKKSKKNAQELPEPRNPIFIGSLEGSFTVSRFMNTHY